MVIESYFSHLTFLLSIMTNHEQCIYSKEITINPEIVKLTRHFEIVKEYRMIKCSDRNFIYHLPRFILLLIEHQFLSYYFGGVLKWGLMLQHFLPRKYTFLD